MGDRKILEAMYNCWSVDIHFSNTYKRYSMF